MYSCIHLNNLNDMETLRNTDIPLVTRFHLFSSYFTVEFGELMPAAFTSRDQSTDKKKLQNMQAQVQIMPY